MVERGHPHAKATCAVARKLVARTWVTTTTGSSYELRDVDGTPVTRRRAKELATLLGRARSGPPSISRSFDGDPPGALAH
jgi:hypothetical protein